MHVTIFTDGAARGNPDGPGGYGAILQVRDSAGNLHEKELSCGYKKTTITEWNFWALSVLCRRSTSLVR